mgnify:CR=1 FL=1|tara:strand:- start:232 stop:1035 length:804 start_codon:yes stop_codon:yes gene_type:complete
MRIVIPSYKRHNKVKTIESIPEGLYPITDIIVREEEYQNYQASYGKLGINIVKIKKKVTNLSQTMQWISEAYIGHILKLDDDLEYKKWNNELNRYEKIKKYELLEIYQWVMKKLDQGYAHVGIGDNSYYTKKGSTSYNCRYYAFTGYNLNIISRLNIRFDIFSIRQDFHVAILLLKKGFPSVVHSKWIISQKSNSSGGCSEYRTKELMKKNAVSFQKYHGGNFIRIKKIKHSNNELDGSYQLTIYWKKIFKSATKKYLPRSYGELHD